MTATIDETADRRRQDRIAAYLLGYAPYLGHQWTDTTVDRLVKDPTATVPASALEVAVMLLTEMGRTMPDEPMGDLATRTGAHLQHWVPDDEAIIRLKHFVDEVVR